MVSGWKNLEKHDGKNLDCLGQSVSRKMDAKVMPASEDSEGSEEHGRENINCSREHLNCCEQTVSRNMDIKGASNEGPEGKEELFLENGGESLSFSGKVWQNFALQLCGKQKWYMMNLDVQLRRFPSKVLKLQPGFLLLLVVKCKKKEINGEKNC